MLFFFRVKYISFNERKVIYYDKFETGRNIESIDSIG